jgi:iron complex transport system ATP-binding protein
MTSVGGEHAPATGVAGGDVVVAVRRATVVRDGNRLLDDVSLELVPERPMVVLGPNGAGKTTLLRLMATRLFPTSGTVHVLGMRLGRGDLRTLRHRIGFASVAMEPLLPATQPVQDLVAAARHGALRLDLRAVDEEDRTAARQALDRIGVAHLADRLVRTLSQGEWQRIQIARALVPGPDLLLLDEPFAGLDLGARERLLDDLDRLLAAPDAPATVLVTHHLEEVPRAVGDATLLAGGRVVATGAIGGVVTDAAVSAAFGLPVAVDRRAGRWTARRQ